MEMNENGTGDRLAGVRETEAALEAILFAAGHPVEYTRIGDALGLAPRDVRTLAEHMRDTRYASPGSGLHMLTFAESCQLCTRENFLPQIREALGIRRGGNLSPSSLEVLAVVNREPGETLTPAQMAALAAAVVELGKPPLFVEPQYEDLSARTLSAETGARVFTLDPVVTGPEENVPPDYYETVMRENMRTLQEALGG